MINQPVLIFKSKILKLVLKTTITPKKEKKEKPKPKTKKNERKKRI